ncbi:MAG: hypothetical protein JW889_12595 [Verrucomicrobia bacterium]|nr:hypothetical protein [Verrucomicrobiota bacterium]
MDKGLPPRSIKAWNAMLRNSLAEKAKLNMSGRLRMLFALAQLGRLVPEHPAYARWREKGEWEVLARWNRIKDRLA